MLHLVPLYRTSSSGYDPCFYQLLRSAQESWHVFQKAAQCWCFIASLRMASRFLSSAHSSAAQSSCLRCCYHLTFPRLVAKSPEELASGWAEKTTSAYFQQENYSWSQRRYLLSKMRSEHAISCHQLVFHQHEIFTSSVLLLIKTRLDQY